MRRLRSERGRRRGRWLLVFALLCTVSLYSIEATHDHKTVQAELRCPICHVFGHSPLDVYTPDLAAALSHALLTVLDLPAPSATALPRSFPLKPQPRAPPVQFTPVA
jgi:hypothetical protein